MKQTIFYELKFYPLSFLSISSSSFSCNSMPCSSCYGVKPNLKKYIVENISPLFLIRHWINLTIKPLRIQKTFHKSKHRINKTDMQKVKQNKSGTYNYKQSKWTKFFINDYSNVRLHGLVGQLNFISLGADFLYPLDHTITDLLFQTNRSKHLTFKY